MEQNNRPAAQGNGAVSTPVNMNSMFKVPGTEVSKPTDFIRANVGGGVIRPPAEVPPVQAEAPATDPVAAPEAPAAAPGGGEPDFALPVETPAEPQAEQQVAGEEEEEIPENPAEVNFKKLRATYKETKDNLKKLQGDLQAATEELEEFRTGKKLPPVLEDKEKEIASLRQYQKIVDLKTSPEYQEKYVAPLTTTSNKLEELFAEYNIPKQALDKVRTLKSVREQNEFLSDHFDQTGAIEVKGLLEKERGLVTAMKEADKEPVKVLEALIQEGENARLVKTRQQREAIQSTFRDSWAKALGGIKEEGVFKELIFRPDDTNFNKTIVEPLLKNASTEASKLMTMLVEDGLTKLRPEVAAFINRMSLLAHSSAVSAATREKALSYAKELEKNSTRQNLVARPNIGGSTGAVGGQGPRERLTPDSMAKKLSAGLGGKS